MGSEMKRENDEMRRLVEQANQACSTGLSAEDYEAAFVAVVDFVHAHPGGRPTLLSLLLNQIREGGGCIEFVEFCAHELRWVEIRQGATDRIASTDDWRIKTPLSNVVRALDADWPDAEIYERWRTKNGGAE